MGHLPQVPARRAGGRGGLEYVAAHHLCDDDRLGARRHPGRDAAVAQPGVPGGRVGLSVDFPRYSGVCAAGVLGPVPVDLPEHPDRGAVRPVAVPHPAAGSVAGVRDGVHRTGPQRSRLHGRNHPCRNHFRPGGADGGVGRPRHVVVDDHAAHGPAAGDAGDRAAHRQRVDQHAQDHLAGHRRAVHPRALYAHPRHLGGALPAHPAAAGGRHLVPGHHQRADGRAVLPGAVLLAGGVAEADDQTA